MTDTVNLGLPLIEAAQAQKHITHNEALRLLDSLVQLAVLDRDLTTPPVSPAEGARWIVAAGATGAWDNHDLEVATRLDGAWWFSPPKIGWLAYVVDEGSLLAWTGSAWVDAIEALTSLNNMVLLGVGTTADSTNPLSVKAPNAMFTAVTAGEGGSGDMRIKVNKETSTDTASHLFQAGFSGRAEFGLIGDNDFSLKVSADGSSWREALRVDRTNGIVAFTQPVIARGRRMTWVPQGNGTVIDLEGFANNATGTATARTVATTNLFASLCRLGFVSAGAAGSSAGTRHGLLQFWRGNATDLGGFFYLTRFGLAQVQANMRAFAGLHSSAAAIGNVNPSTLLNLVGIGFDSGQTTWRILTNDGSGTATLTDLGANFPANTASTDLYELALWCAPNESVIHWRVERLNTGDVAEDAISADLPVNTTLLSPQIWVNNGTAAAAVAIDVAGQYLETLY